MSQPPPRPSPKPASPAPADPPVSQAAATPGRVLNPVESHTIRLRKSLGEIDSNPSTPTAVRSLIGEYYKLANPRDAERSRVGTNKWDVFFHVVNSAVAALQNAYRLDAVYAASSGAEKEHALAVVQAAIKVLDSRILKLEVLAKLGSEEWVLKGTDADGYYLISVTEHKRIQKSEIDLLYAAQRNVGGE